MITNKVVLDARTLGQLPQLRYIGVCATGTNVVDLAAARQRGIAVTNVPGYAAESVAQTVFAAVLHFAAESSAPTAPPSNPATGPAPDFCFFRKPLFELAGKRLVIVGLGAIGGAVAAHRPRLRHEGAGRGGTGQPHAAPTGSTWARSCRARTWSPCTAR